jgi:hypothetical protein
MLHYNNRLRFPKRFLLLQNISVGDTKKDDFYEFWTFWDSPCFFLNFKNFLFKGDKDIFLDAFFNFCFEKNFFWFFNLKFFVNFFIFKEKVVKIFFGCLF